MYYHSKLFINKLPLLLLILGVVVGGVKGGWGGSDKVKLKDIEVLTLRHGQYTQGRRSAPVPQLKCVGGTAGCSAFVPQVVQCYNKGSDGFDVQWECKTDMDNAFRFGRVEVICEGYDYPDDPYVLKGSCGLEYTIDLTKEGMANQGQQQQHNYYGGDGGGAYDQGKGYGWNIPPTYKKQGSNALTNIACLVVLAIIVYAFYQTCIAPNANNARQYSRTNDDYPSGGGGGGTGNRPPPPGFYFPGTGGTNDYSTGDSCGAGSGSSSYRQGTGAGPTGGGFWTGAATGGLLGYLFGNRGNTGNTNYSYARQRPSTSYGFGGDSGYSTSFGGGSGAGTSTSSTSSSTGTRTASGFGGTRRR